MPAETINDLLELSHELGRPDRRLAILGEGNTSARADSESFWVKASGSELGSLRTDQMVRVSLAACLELLDGPDLSDTQIKDALLAAVVEGGDGVRPSVETVLHAALLELPGIGFVGHTHPESINALTCSTCFALLPSAMKPWFCMKTVFGGSPCSSAYARAPARTARASGSPGST
jgi:rhamnose utilization protein RhaD (predicted bifunctional aldolase and dehydrogenase)